MLTKYEIEEEEFKPKIKHPEPEFHWRYNLTGMQRNYITYADYYDVHDVPTIEPIEYRML